MVSLSTTSKNLVGIIWKGKFRGQKQNGLLQNLLVMKMRLICKLQIQNLLNGSGLYLMTA